MGVRESLVDRIRPPDDTEFRRGFMTSFGLNTDLVRGTLWPALYGQRAASELLRASRKCPVRLILDRVHGAGPSQADVGGWPLLAPRGCGQHSKVWLLEYVEHDLSPARLRLFIGSHNLDMSSFAQNAELTVCRDFLVGKANEPEWLNVLFDAAAFLEVALHRCDPAGKGRRVETALRDLRDMLKPFKSRARSAAARRSVHFVASGPGRGLWKAREQEAQGRSLADVVPDGMSGAKTKNADEVVMITPFFDRSGGGTCVFETISMQAPAIRLIGPAVSRWERGNAMDRWMKSPSAFDVCTSAGPLDRPQDQVLHAKAIAWRFGAQGVLYVGSGNLTQRGLMEPPLSRKMSPGCGRFEAGLVMSMPWPDLRKWLRREFATVSLDLADLARPVPPPPEELQYEDSPILEIELSRDPPGLSIAWAEGPVPGTLHMLDERLVAADATNPSGPLPLPTWEVGCELMFVRQTDGRRFTVPVVEEGLPHSAPVPFTLEDALRSYRCGMVQASLDDEESDADNPEGTKRRKKVRTRDLDPWYPIRTGAEAIHVIQEHARALSAIDQSSSDLVVWFREDYPRLLQELGKEPYGPTFVDELRKAVCEDAKPDSSDTKRSRAWREALKAANRAMTTVAAEKGARNG